MHTVPHFLGTAASPDGRAVWKRWELRRVSLVDKARGSEVVVSLRVEMDDVAAQRFVVSRTEGPPGSTATKTRERAVEVEPRRLGAAFNQACSHFLLWQDQCTASTYLINWQTREMHFTEMAEFISGPKAYPEAAVVVTGFEEAPTEADFATRFQSYVRGAS